MNRRTFTQLAAASSLAAMGPIAHAAKATQPNLLIIHTDEHNFRTLGCYRDQLSDDQAFVWGKGVEVKTPHIDSLARDGALCTSFYAASPVCTPSRASFISGLYPQATGSPMNDMPLNDGLVSFAEILKRNGYATSYVGKWHLDGHAKPGFAPKRQFGFSDNRYMFNRGHWKLFEETAKGPYFIGTFNPKTNSTKYNIDDATEISFATDFLVDRTIEIIERDKAKPFCVMLSLPDPHGPNTVRAPYDEMYTHMTFEEPRTMHPDIDDTPAWNAAGKQAAGKLIQRSMAQYFGMVKCIDDNVGKMLAYLKANGLDKNTIVIFTSDHGDLMGEHNRHNKGVPYETSAGIPFVIRYPGKVKPGKLIHTAYTTTDFAPTILSMMGAGGQLKNIHGVDGSKEFLSSAKETRDDRIVYITHANKNWVCAVNHHYKLVLTPVGKPWLFDLEKDPDELINFHGDPEYAPIVEKFETRLHELMAQYGEAIEPGQLLGPNDTPPPAGTKGGGKVNPGKILKPQETSASGYMIDASDISRNVPSASSSSWNRVITVPEGSFDPNSSYELIVDWESKGLAEGAEFYANFIGDRANKKQKQTVTWTGATGKTGTAKAILKTDDYAKWQLIVGIKSGGGHLVVKRIRVKEQ